MSHITAEKAVDLIPVDSAIVVSPACSTPTTLVRSMAMRCDKRGWSLLTGLFFSPESIADVVHSGALRYVTWHVTSALEPLLAAGQISYVPLRASRVPAQLARWKPDASLVRVTVPDRHGWCSLGPSVSYVRAALDHARLRIAEVDPDLPRTWGLSMVHVSQFDALVESTEPLPMYEAASPNPVSEAIASYIIGILPDRPLLQLGIGSVPEALVIALAKQGVNNLRFTGMGSEGMVDLDERGLLDCHPTDGYPPILAPDLLGTRRLMRWAHDNPSVGVYPSTIAQNPLKLATRERLVSINSAIEVDFKGQVNSERVRGRQISGIGGSIDFVEGAYHSPGGLRIIALPSSTSNGEISRIVPSLDERSMVTIPGGLVQVVVTEHGVAWLEGCDTRQRAEALIAIAAPHHRESLTKMIP